MAAPKVSVVIPAYNRERTIGRAVESVLAQTMKELEVIVVDDASTDGTADAVLGIADPRVRLLRHDTNRRAAAARNTGVRAATGRYVAFLDSDDEWLPGKLAAQVADLEAAPKEVRASCTGYFIVDRGEVFTKVPALVTYREIFMGCDLSPGTTLVARRDVFDEVGLNDEAFYRYEDWDWVLRYTARYRMGVLTQPLARVHRGGLPPALPMAGAAGHFLEKHAGALAAFGPMFRRRVVALRWFEVAHHFYRERAFGPGTAYFLKGVLTWPFVRPGMYVLVLDGLMGLGLQRRLWRMRRAFGKT